MTTPEYPTEEQLQKIKDWDAANFHGLLAYIKPLWAFDSWGWSQDGERYNISTGGWSGNEDIIGAMQSNQIWWMMYWQQSARGGHYIFIPLNAALKLHGITVGES